MGGVEDKVCWHCRLLRIFEAKKKKQKPVKHKISKRNRQERKREKESFFVIIRNIPARNVSKKRGIIPLGEGFLCLQNGTIMNY